MILRAKYPLILLLLAAACAPSPLYAPRSDTGGTVGEIPRDGRGEPLWGGIRPVPPPPLVAPGIPASPRVPIIPPPGP